ncbi:MAG TPA: M13 family metallopeptidase [Candidatus Levilactobacillus faecigallinarum]|uniref:M13 family metallopeptidase n=1 Tax=Candidatus Levilactobacillus faecigallinarum TaxID=2838638 RepID=A0A9D1QR22_9LACO|nr:M13 family metallopeptidase [Candidatus Levilactobacillus faecigallinarum]
MVYSPKFSINERLIKHDLYEAVNADWEKHTVIPEDQSQTGTFDNLARDVQSTLMRDLQDLATGKIKPSNLPMHELRNFYQVANDSVRQLADGTQPLKKFLTKITRLRTLSDLVAHLPEFCELDIPLPFTLSVFPDMQDATTYILYLDVPKLILPNKSYYTSPTPATQNLLTVYQKTAERLLRRLDYSAGAATQLVNRTRQFDAHLYPHMKAPEDLYDMDTYYNSLSLTEINSLIPQLRFPELTTKLLGRRPNRLVTPEPDYLKSLGSLLTEENFSLIKSWLLVKTVMANSQFLTDELRVLGNTYSRALYGQKIAISRQKFIFHLAKTYFNQAIGDYYGRHYFGEEAKQNAHDMVMTLVAIYKQRLRQNTWLSSTTRQFALKKLDKLVIHVGYPDQLSPIYNSLLVDPSKSFFDNIQHLKQTTRQFNFHCWEQSVDQSLWTLLSGADVNAYYSPRNNAVFFPAAILQPPFYDLKQTSSANYGAIGAVMGHEISHAFDANGSHFDEFGNLHNWWTKSDFNNFQKLNQKMISEFDGAITDGQKINGTLTLTENTADAGGLSCALSATKALPAYNLRTFFMSWAMVWRSKYTPESLNTLLSTDSHAPAKARVNLQVQNLDDFYTTFDVHPGDGMYLAPEQRVHIW